MTAEDPLPPAGVPAHVADALSALDDGSLRASLAYGRRLLADRQPTPADAVEALPGERVLDVERHEGYAVVVKEQPCAAGCADCPHGPYVYHVAYTPRSDGGTDLDWTFLGRHVDDGE